MARTHPLYATGRSDHRWLIGLALLIGWVVVGALGFMWIEGWSFLESLYMAVITISTVGFQEVHPLSDKGRLFATVLIVAGLTTAAYTFARVGQLILEGELAALLGRRRMRRELERLKDHVIVCGFGRIGKPVAEGLARHGLPFCVVERDPALEPELGERGYVYILGDATDEEVLREAGLERARTVLALLPSDADNLYLTMTAKSVRPEVTVVARAVDERAEMRLKRGGADRVVSPNQIAAARILGAAVRPAVVEFLELVTHREHLPLRLEELRVRESSPLAGHSLAQAGLRRRYGVIVVAIQRPGGEMRFNPDPGEPIEAGDVLVALGREEDLARLERECAEGAAAS